MISITKQSVFEPILNAWKKFLTFFPSRLPRGRKEFDDFCSSILSIYGMPNEPTYIHAIGTMILHIGPNHSRKSKRFFANSLIKSQANQVSFAVLQEIKEAEKKKKEEGAIEGDVSGFQELV